jgi:hypothetical protein
LGGLVLGLGLGLGFERRVSARWRSGTQRAERRPGPAL